MKSAARTLARRIGRSSVRARGLMVIALLAVIGSIYLVSGSAAWLYASAEPESGMVTVPATTVSDASASGGQGVKFGTGGGLTGVPTKVTGWWWSDQANVPLGAMGCSSSSGTATANALNDQWDYWDNCGGSEVSIASEGLPAAPWGGDRVVKWYKPGGDSNTYQKLNRSLTKDNWPNGSGSANTGSPADVSGRYIVYQYIPSAKFTLNPTHGWAILSEFKENYTDTGGAFRQDPTWYFGCNNFSGAVRCNLAPNSKTILLSSYMDRWVKWEYRIYQGTKDTTGHGGRIELYADDVLLDTGFESTEHVGSAAFSPLSSTKAWIWIAGQYTSNQDTNGVPDYQNTNVTSYVGLSTILPLP